MKMETKNTEAKRRLATHDEEIDSRYRICVYIQHFNFLQSGPNGAVVNTVTAQSGGRRFESLRVFASFVKFACL